MSAHPFRSYVTISRSQIAANFRNVRDAVGRDVIVCGVVKADAYGHGAIEVSKVGWMLTPRPTRAGSG